MLSPLIFAALLSNPHEPDGIGFVELPPARTASILLGEGLITQTQEWTAQPGFDWNEAVVSWNLAPGHGVALTIDAKAGDSEGESGLYKLGHWTLEPKGRRESTKDQSDDWGKVDTDTLVLKRPARSLKLIVTVTSPRLAPLAVPKFLGVSFRNSAITPKFEEANKEAWGKTIEAPRRSQMSYEGGNVWCSPTCVSMMLWHWANVLRRPELNKDVPEVAANVNDPNWPGTGNWPFNTAYAGSFSGIRAYVSRFGSIREIEDWIAARIPVVTSVSSALLKGRPKKESNDGHLVVVVGFTREGDPVFNDPGRSLEIRQTYKREHFEAAWKSSGNTVYLIYPESMKPPANRLKHWAD